MFFQGLQNQWQPVTEQVRFNAFNIRILVQINVDCQASLAALQAQVDSSFTSAEKQFLINLKTIFLTCLLLLLILERSLYNKLLWSISESNLLNIMSTTLVKSLVNTMELSVMVIIPTPLLQVWAWIVNLYKANSMRNFLQWMYDLKPVRRF